MKLVRRDLIALSDGLRAVGNLKGIKFCYATAKNGAKIDREMKAMQSGLKATPEYTKYDTERIDLCKKHADKDENGKPKMASTQKPGEQVFVGLEGNAEFDVEATALKETYKDAISEREGLIEDYNTALDEEIEFDLHMIQFKDIPQDTITASQLRGIIDIVEGEPEKDDTSSDKK